MLYTHFQSSPHSAGFAFSHCDLMLCWLVAADWLDISSPPALYQLAVQAWGPNLHSSASLLIDSYCSARRSCCVALHEY